jgi:hypothetical protein
VSLLTSLLHIPSLLLDVRITARHSTVYLGNTFVSTSLLGYTLRFLFQFPELHPLYFTSPSEMATRRKSTKSLRDEEDLDKQRRQLPSGAGKHTREFHTHADEKQKSEIVQVAYQDPTNVLLHPTEAGDPYYIGDIYHENPLKIRMEWEIPT